MNNGRILAWRAAWIFAMCAAWTQAASAQNSDITDISLENLMNVKVTSVSRQEEEWRKTAAAVYVITRDDIRRSGMTDVADLLRMAPGVEVAQMAGSVWAVGVRGFNAQYSTQLLVMVDGRSVYDPTFGGVYWQLQNLIVEDIDRIEIIRGPGATMWGANAVNGVISITTRRPADTQGGLVVADAGSGKPGEGSFRFGGTIGKNAFYRLYARQTTRSSLQGPAGQPGGDAWNLTSPGFRLDWKASAKDSFTFDVEAYRGVFGSRQSVLTSLSPVTSGVAGLIAQTGNHVLARWDHTFADSSNLKVQFFGDNRRLNGLGAKDVDILDFDLQHNFNAGPRHSVVWGIGHSAAYDRFFNTPAFGVVPDHQRSDLTSAFVQDKIALAHDRLQVTVGSKFERNSFSGYTVQPAARLAWAPSVRHSAWFSAARAVRNVKRVERGMYLNLATFPAGSSTGLVNLYGQEGTRNEGLMAYEAGYRYQSNKKFWLDIATFYNDYDHLETVEPGPPFVTLDGGTPLPVAPLYFGNAMMGETHGAETTVNYRVNDRLTLKGGYSFLRMALHGYAEGGAAASEGIEGQNPRNQFQIGTSLNLPKALELSGHIYFTGSLPSYGVERYTRVDLNLTWKALDTVELSIAGQNLLGHHLEFGDNPSPSNLIARGIHGRIAWKF